MQFKAAMNKLSDELNEIANQTIKGASKGELN
jgi:hypothetical protein